MGHCNLGFASVHKLCGTPSFVCVFSIQNLHLLFCVAQVIEAQLTLLLRLSSARRSSLAQVTDDVHIIGKLIDCKVMIPPLMLETKDPRLGSSCACLVSCSMQLMMVSSVLACF